MQIPKETVRALSFAGYRDVGKINKANFLLIAYDITCPAFLPK
jgi:hypothetical protein